MTTPQKLCRRSCLSRTKKILQHRRQDQSQSQRIQRDQRRAESSLGAEVVFIFNVTYIWRHDHPVYQETQVKPIR